MLTQAQQVSNKIQGADIKDFETTKLNNGTKMFVVPVTAEVKVLSAEPQSYQLKESIMLPEMGPTESEASYTNRVAQYVEQTVVQLKEQALFEFADSKNASLIISPSYSIKTESSKNYQVNVVVKVKGYPAVYTKFRSIMPSDTILMKTGKNIPDNKIELTPVMNVNMETEEKTTVEEDVVIRKQAKLKEK
ncbi:MAG TPA: hypothetical protein DEO38_02830 [Bacteroidales bacterium]|nr:hypothetical protein [Bacteroidales bacterium]